MSVATLASAGVLNLQDSDSATKMFVITNISAGTLYDGGTLVTAHTTAPNQTPVPLNSTRVLAGETLTFVPSAATVGVTEIFRIRGYDGEGFSDEVRVKVNFAPSYTTPTITQVDAVSDAHRRRCIRFGPREESGDRELVNLGSTVPVCPRPGTGSQPLPVCELLSVGGSTVVL